MCIWRCYRYRIDSGELRKCENHTGLQLLLKLEPKLAENGVSSINSQDPGNLEFLLIDISHQMK